MLWLKPSEIPASPHAYEVQGMNRVARLSGLGVASPRLQPPGVRGRQYPIYFSKFRSRAASWANPPNGKLDAQRTYPARLRMLMAAQNDNIRKDVRCFG